MPINTELLKQTLEYIEAHPDEWEQSEWRCGSAMCFAGHAATLSGCSWNLYDQVEWPNDKKVTHVRTYALHVLGLTPIEAERLFHGANTLRDLKLIVADLCSVAEEAKKPLEQVVEPLGFERQEEASGRVLVNS